MRRKSAYRGFRLHIGLFGRRNVGKSSLLNALTRQGVSIVSEEAGTTTDPVEKPMELLPIGPVLFIDTAGVDDSGALGAMRVEKTRRRLDRTDLAIIVTDHPAWASFEEGLREELAARRVPVIAVFTKADNGIEPEAETTRYLESVGVPVVRTAADGTGLGDLRAAIAAAAPEDHQGPVTIAGDLIPAGGVAVLVVPIDKEAPRGRLILPQVQTIRDLLDHNAACIVVQEAGLSDILSRLRSAPDLVITDSQAFEKVAADTPDEIPVTGFSILFARLKGDLCAFAHGAAAIGGLRPGDRILVAESCTHHPIEDDIGRVKLPGWLARKAGGELVVEACQGADFPEDLSSYRLILQCGGCMLNRRSITSRIRRATEAKVPITNYGVAIAECLGMTERVLGPFPEALRQYRMASRREVA